MNIEETEAWLINRLNEKYGGNQFRLPNRINLPQEDWIEILEQYAQQREVEKCDSCIYSYQNKNAKGYHDVEEFYDK